MTGPHSDPMRTDMNSGRLSASARDMKLRVLQFSRSKPPDDLPTIMNIPRKALIDDINGPYAVLQSPSNQSTLKVTFVTPRDIRKIDPAFATRLEPTILVRTGCIIVAFGRCLHISLQTLRARATAAHSIRSWEPSTETSLQHGPLPSPRWPFTRR